MRLTLNGKLPTKEELAGDELIAQMLKEAEEKGKVSVQVPDRATIIQSLKIEEVPETLKVELRKDIPTKESVLQSLTVEDIDKMPDPVKQKVAEIIKPSPEMANFLKGIGIVAQSQGGGAVNDDDKKKVKSALRLRAEAQEAVRIY